MCERCEQRGCCIVYEIPTYVGKLSFMPEKRASPRLNISHVDPAVSPPFFSQGNKVPSLNTLFYTLLEIKACPSLL